MARVGLDVGLVNVRIPLGEVLVIATDQGDVFRYIDESLIKSAGVVTCGNTNHITVSGLIKCLLDILVRGLGRPSVVLVGSGA